MSQISSNLIKEAVYKLCFEANTCLNKEIYLKILKAYQDSDKNTEINGILKTIIQNAKIAYYTKKPLCQDTGQVIVFLEIGQDVNLKGDFIENVINEGVEKCYIDNFFRKSVVKNAVFDRVNTKNNTPVIIHTKIIKEDCINIKVLIKGAGSENKSKLEMMLPTSTEEEIIQKIGELILSVGENSCPPMFIGVGIGGTSEQACIMSKETYVEDNFTEDEINLADKIKNYVNNKSPEKYEKNFLLDVKVKTMATHIACMPIAITINCHSDRTASCTIKGNKVHYSAEKPDFIDLCDEKEKIKEIQADDIESIKKLQKGEKVLLTGEIYVARDAAHRRLMELIKTEKPLPFDYKNKIIFYAGPCPNKPGEVIGSIGPTTSSRMDKYAVILYNNGLLGTIGKGSRNSEVELIIKDKGAKYFTVTGGIAALLSQKVVKSKIIAFEDLGAEAIYKINVDKLELKVEIS